MDARPDPPRASFAAGEDARARLAKAVRESPLLETRPSLRSLKGAAIHTHPRTVFLGIGLGAARDLTDALPFDTLGLILAGELVRRAVNGERMLVLVADAHAREQGLASGAVSARAAHVHRTLQQIARRCQLSHMRVVLASQLAERKDYKRVLSSVRSQAPAKIDPYVTREVADIAHMQARHGGLIKVGWALKPAKQGAARDERMFDDSFRTWVNDQVWFVYGKPGRVLDDRRPKAPPYVERDRNVRICLDAREDVKTKLTARRGRISESNWRGVCNHLRAITRAYSELVTPLDGPIANRTQTVIDQLTQGRPLRTPRDARA